MVLSVRCSFHSLTMSRTLPMDVLVKEAGHGAWRSDREPPPTHYLDPSPLVRQNQKDELTRPILSPNPSSDDAHADHQRVGKPYRLAGSESQWVAEIVVNQGLTNRGAEIAYVSCAGFCQLRHAGCG